MSNTTSSTEATPAPTLFELVMQQNGSTKDLLELHERAHSEGATPEDHSRYALAKQRRDRRARAIRASFQAVDGGVD